MNAGYLLRAVVLGGVLCLGGEPDLAAAQYFQALYVFGDSLDATSGGPYWEGRWSSGPMWPELLSTNLGFPYRPGNNRAAGGATCSQILSQVRSLAAPTNAASALFIIDVGHQDFVPYINQTNELSWSNALRSATLNISNSVVECYRKGGRAVAIMDCMDPNRIPRLARLISNPAYMRDRVQQLNALLNTMADQLAATYLDLRLLRIDIFALFEALETHFDYYGFTRIDLGALEDSQLADKSYQGPGKNYMFWDANHMTAKGHALAARVFLAVLRGSAIRIHPQSDGFRLAFDSLQIGKTYHAQQSADLVHWEELASFYALDTSQELAVVRSIPCCFYRLLSQ